MDGLKIVAKLCNNLYTVSEIGCGDIVSFDKMFVQCVMFASSDSEEDTEDTDSEDTEDTVEKNGALLGVAVTSDLTGDLCWAAALGCENSSVRIEAVEPEGF